MPRMTHAAVCAALALGVALASAGCATSGLSSHPSSAPTASPALPSPFTIVARWSAAHLGLLYPRALAIGPHGNLYVTDNHYRVTVISPEGSFVRRWGSLGSGPGEFGATVNDYDSVDLHLRIEVAASGLVYVADSGNGRVQIFTPQGGFVRQFSSLGSGNGQLLSPDYFAVDSDGSAYLSDDSIAGVMKFSAQGTFLWRDSSETSSDPDLAGGLIPGGFDSHGRLVVANADRSRIFYLDPQGHKVGAFDLGASLLGGPCEATVDAQGYTYVTACGPQQQDTAGFVGGPGCDTLVFNRSHTLVARWSGAPHQALVTAPYFGPDGEVFALGWDGSLLKLKLTLPGG
jgi:DNA-binding beta-propeller fold protein YncE